MTLYGCQAVSNGYSTSYEIDPQTGELEYVLTTMITFNYTSNCGCIFSSGPFSVFSPIFFYQNPNKLESNQLQQIFQLNASTGFSSYGTTCYIPSDELLTSYPTNPSGSTTCPNNYNNDMGLQLIPGLSLATSNTTITTNGVIQNANTNTKTPGTVNSYTFPDWFSEYTDGVGYTNAYYFNGEYDGDIPLFVNYVPGQNKNAPIIFNSSCVPAISNNISTTNQINTRTSNIYVKNSRPIIPGLVSYVPKNNFDIRSGEFSTDIIISQRGIFFKDAIFQDGIIITVDSSQAIFDSCTFKGNFSLICQGGALIILQPGNIVLESTNPQITIVSKENSQFIINGNLLMPNVNFSAQDIITSIITWNITNQSDIDFSNYNVIHPTTKQEITSVFNVIKNDASVFQSPISNRNFYIIEEEP